MPTYSSYCTFDTTVKPLDPAVLRRSMMRAKESVDHWEGKPNSFFIPRGIEPGWGWILLLGSDAKAIDRSTTHTLTFEGPNTVTLSNLIVTELRCLTSETWGTIPDNSAVLVTLRDIRYKCKLSVINEGVNLRLPNNTESLNYTSGADDKYYATGDTTWAGLISLIEANLPVFVSIVNASFPSSLPENYQLRGLSALEALAKVARDTGHFITLNQAGTTLSLVTGSYAAVQPAFTGVHADWNGGEAVGTSTLDEPQPETIRVFFPKRNYAFQGGSAGEPHWNDTLLTDPLYHVDVASSGILHASVPILSGTFDYLHSSLIARYDEDGTLLNGSDLSATATSLATTFLLGKSADHERGIFYGAWAALLDANYAKVGWYDTGSGLFTKIGCEDTDPVLMSDPDHLGSYLSNLIPAGPPHLGTDHEDPDRWGVAELTAGLGDPDQDDGKYRAFTARIKYGGYDLGTETITWSNAQDTIKCYDAQSVGYEVGDRVYVIFHRQVERWLIVGNATAQAVKPVRFKMKSNMELGGKGFAIEIGTGPTYTEIGSVFPIKDPWLDPGMWRDDFDNGQIEGGYMGWCLIPDNPEIYQFNPQEDPPEAEDSDGDSYREIIWMEQIARSINLIRIDQNQDPQGEADIVPVIGNGDWYLQGKDPNDLIVPVPVEDPLSMFPHGNMDGAAGIARYNDQEHVYELVNSDQMSILLSATLGEDISPNTSVASVNNTQVMTFSPLGMAPDPPVTTALNLLGFSGRIGDEVVLAWHETLNAWIIIAANQPSNGRLIRFQMTSVLPLGGSGTAVEISSGPAYTVLSPPFPIKDPWTNPGMWRDTTASYKGWCIIPDNPQSDGQGDVYREIVWMEQIARSITFTATSDMAGGVVSISIDNYYLQGKDPAAASVSLAYDPQNIFPYIITGCKGKARYNDRSHIYEIVAADQMAILVKATLNSNLCPGDPSASVVSPAAMTFSPYGTLPAAGISAAVNNLSLAGYQGDTCVLAWDESQGQYMVLQVMHRAQQVITDIRAMQVVDSAACEAGSSGDGDTACRLEYKYRNVVLMACEDESDWTQFISFSSQEVLTDWFIQGLAIKGMATKVWVPCLCDEYEVNLEEGVDCSSGSGSGQ